MIIKVPIYIEVEGRFSPSEGSDLTRDLRIQMTSFFIQKSGGTFSYSDPKYGKGIIKVLTETQVKNRLMKNSPFSGFDGA